MGKNKGFTPEYKKEIIRLITDQGKKVKDVAIDIGVSQTSVRRWIKQYSDHGENAFPGKGKLRPEDGVIFHSYRGVQYEVYDYQNRLKQYNMIQSMSRKSNCYDNAPIARRKENQREITHHIK